MALWYVDISVYLPSKAHVYMFVYLVV